jgi:DNA repair exonuclease SbcCD nuclease subunit
VKILLVSDLHYALKQFDWTVAAAQRVDLVVIAGDHVDIVGRMDGGMQVVVILKYLRKLAASTQLIVSSGNHDLDQRDASGEKIATWMEKVRALGAKSDGDSAMFGDMLVTICPWWDGPHAKQAVADQLARDAAREKKKWLWVYHGPPPVRRHGSRGVDRAIRAGHRVHRSHPRSAVQARRLMGRSYRRYLGVQFRPANWADARAYFR